MIAFQDMILLVMAPFVGSFLGVLAYRLPLELSVVVGRSVCDGCQRVLRPLQLLPVFGYYVQKGRCETCETRIPALYPGLELAAFGMALWAVTVTDGAVTWISCALGWALLTLAAIDMRHFWLPDVLTLPLLLCGLATTYWLQPEALNAALLGAALGYAAFRLIGWGYALMRGQEGLGQGDAKLFAAAGAWLGWAALPAVLLWAALGGLAFMLAMQWDRGNALPFGPFLAMGIWITWLYGPLEVMP
ncbi:MAG: prepilin peptidase [Magnetospiraceae bacterium]